MSYDRSSGLARFSPEWWESRTMPEPNTGCVLWLGSACRLGYGRAWSGGRLVLVHRLAYTQAFGPFDAALKVCHRCDTPSCVNPDHLFLGTQEENLRDMYAKGRGRPRGTSAMLPLTPRALALENSNSSVMMADKLHLMRTRPMATGWRVVTGVPAWRQDHDGPSCECPRLGTAKPSTPEGDGLATVAVVAGCWPTEPRAGASLARPHGGNP